MLLAAFIVARPILERRRAFFFSTFAYTVLCFLANRLQLERLAERVEQLNAKFHIR